MTNIMEEISKMREGNTPLQLDFKAYQNMDKNDNIDHIRIGMHSITTLGKNLSIDYIRTFYHPQFGSFVSVQSAIEWLRLEKKDDNVRGLSGKNLIEYIDKEIESGNNSYGQKHVSDEDMASIIFYSLMSKPELLEMLSNNNLPFCYYFMVNETYAKVQNIQYTNILTRVVPYILNLKKH